MLTVLFDAQVCDYNRDGDSYRSVSFRSSMFSSRSLPSLHGSMRPEAAVPELRPTLLRSPWTNTYDPPLSDGTEPSPKLRSLEVSMNDAFDVYRDL